MKPEETFKTKMMPGQTPYTPEEQRQLEALVRDAADEDPGEENEPRWGPLEIATEFNGASPHDFMAMGMVDGLHTYKHIMTRHYLYLDEAGNAYDPHSLAPISRAAAIQWAYN